MTAADMYPGPVAAAAAAEAEGMQLRAGAAISKGAGARRRSMAPHPCVEPAPFVPAEVIAGEFMMPAVGAVEISAVSEPDSERRAEAIIWTAEPIIIGPVIIPIR
jgi:hypothetical protein